MDTVRVGIVGLGWFGNFHLEYLLTRSDVEVTALVSTNREKLQKAGQRVPGAKHYEDVSGLLRDKAVDALIICVPPHRHDGIEQQAAGAGVHLYIEKPLGIDLAAAKQIQAAVEAAGIVCAVGYQCRYENGVEEMRRYLAENPAGLVQASWMGDAPAAHWWRRLEESGGQVVEQTTHMVDLMRYMCGEADAVTGMAETALPVPLEGATVAGGSAALIQFKNGTAASLLSGCFNGGEAKAEMYLQFNCRQAAVRYDWTDGVSFVTAGGETRHAPTGTAHASSMAAFLQAVKTGDNGPILSPYADALETFRLTLAIETAIRTGRRVELDSFG